MTAVEACRELFEKYGHAPWYVSCGSTSVNETEIIHLMTVKRLPQHVHRSLQKLARFGYAGFPVKIVRCGRMRLADG